MPFFQKEHLPNNKIIGMNKAHSHDTINIRMLNLYGKLIRQPLEIIFKTCLQNATFQLGWKKNQCCPYC